MSKHTTKLKTDVETTMVNNALLKALETINTHEDISSCSEFKTLLKEPVKLSNKRKYTHTRTFWEKKYKLLIKK